MDSDTRLYYLLCSATAGPPVAYIEDLRDEIINVIIGGDDAEDADDAGGDTVDTSVNTPAPMPCNDATVEVV